MPGKKPARQVPGPGRTWNLDDIQELLDVLAGREITEFEMEQAGVKIRVKRGNVQIGTVSAADGGHAGGSPGMTTPLPLAPPPPPVPSPAPVTQQTEPAAESLEGLFIMKSPIVGTFYAAPSPNAPAFVNVGDTVEVGQVLCIIEAMKLMNELEAEVAGKVVRIYVENGQPVEYGESLFAIEPSPKK